MKIAIFCDTFFPEINGVATSVTMLFNVLKAHGHEVYAITTNPFSKKLEYKDNIFRMPGIKLKKLYGYIIAGFYSRKIAKFLKEKKIDLIHVQHDAGVGQFGWICQKAIKCASVYTYHTNYEDYTYYATKGKIDRFAKWVVRDYFRNISERCDELIVPSEKSKNYARRIGITQNINVVPTGLDLDRFLNYKQDIDRKVELFKKYNIPLDAKIVIYLGRLAEEKNIEEMLEFFKYYLDESKDLNTYLLIIGDGPLKDKYVKHAKDIKVDDRAIFLGKSLYDDVPFYYSLGQIFISNSTSETQGLTYVEAMASRLILLVKFDVNLTELIQNGYNGFFFDTKENFFKNLGKILNFNTTTYNEKISNALTNLDSWGLETFYERVMVVYYRARRKIW